MDQALADLPLRGRGRADVRVAIAGAGFAGVGLAAVLIQAGYTSITIFERGPGVGGTWRDNTYPGAACDVPSHLYSFSFAPKADWRHHYAGQADILAYLEDVAARFGVTRCVRTDTAVTGARYDEARAVWRLTTSRGDAGDFDVFVPAVGQLSLPQIPDLPGLAGFAGAQFHAARWDHAVDLRGKRVAVVGSAASAVQIVPHLGAVCAQVSVFQRSPNWIIPRPNLHYGARMHAALRHVPGLRRLLRGAIYAGQEFLYGAFRTGSRRNRLVTALAKAHLRQQVNDPLLRAKLTPSYTLGCKRLLVSSDYLPCFNQDNVELVTETIEAVTTHGLRTTDGTERAFDALVFATGFDVRNCLRPVDIVGIGGLALQQAWAEGPQAYRGVAAPGFPNMFFLYGPNTNLGHSSIVFMLECQFAYVRRCLDRLVAGRFAAIEVKPEASSAYNANLQLRLGGMVWATGCGNWYGQDGRITANWSGSTTAFWRQMRRVRWADFRLTCHT